MPVENRYGSYDDETIAIMPGLSASPAIKLKLTVVQKAAMRCTLASPELSWSLSTKASESQR
jgi:hypothetical protein